MARRIAMTLLNGEFQGAQSLLTASTVEGPTNVPRDTKLWCVDRWNSTNDGLSS
jgi:hypothetical protein